jgi:hypothetical protein
MIEKVLAFAQSEGHIDEDRVNPAIWSRLKDSLPNPDDSPSGSANAAINPLCPTPTFPP